MAASRAGRLLATLLSFRPFLRPHRETYLLMVCMIATEASIALVQPVFYRHLVDDALGAKGGSASIHLLIVYLATLAALRLAAGLAGIWRQIQQSRIVHGVTMEIENAVYRRFETLPMAYHDRHAAGESLRRLYGDPGKVTAFLVELAPSTMESVARGIAALAIITSTLWWAGLLALAPLPLLALLAVWSGRRFHRLSQLSFARSKRLYLHVLDTLRGIRLVRVFGQADAERARFEKLQRGFRDTQLLQSYNDAWISPAMANLSRIGGVAVFIAGAVAAVNARISGRNDFSLGDLFMLMGYVWQLAQPLARLGHLASEMGQIGAAAGRLRSILDEPPDSSVPTAGAPESTAAPAIIFDGVEFGYRTDQKVLGDVSFTIRHGEIVGLVGVNGSGKTTLANLLCGSYRPRHGQVLVGGRDAHAINAQPGRRLVALAPQDAPLFQRTIRQNLTYGRPAASEEEIWGALETVRMAGAIRQLPRGLVARVGEGADQLSAGQRQRLSLARALLSAAPIVVLDEAMSWIDSEDRARIWERLRNMERRPTFLVISHHEQVIRDVDRILLVEGGTVRPAPPPA